MGYISSGEAIGSRRTPLIFAGRLSDLVDTPNVRNTRRGMPTKAIKHGYAFADAAQKAALRKLLKRIFNEVPSAHPSHPPNEVDDDESTSDSSGCNPRVPAELPCKECLL